MVDKELEKSIQKQSEFKENINIPMNTAEAIKVLKKLQKDKVVLRKNSANILGTLAVQHILAEIGLFDKNRDGLFGVETESAVKKFQYAGVADAQLKTWKQDGVVGKDTIAELLLAIGDVYSETTQKNLDNNHLDHSQVGDLHKEIKEVNVSEEGISFGNETAPIVINKIDGEKIKYFRNDTDGLYYTYKSSVSVSSPAVVPVKKQVVDDKINLYDYTFAEEQVPMVKHVNVVKPVVVENKNILEALSSNEITKDFGVDGVKFVQTQSGYSIVDINTDNDIIPTVFVVKKSGVISYQILNGSTPDDITKEGLVKIVKDKISKPVEVVTEDTERIKKLKSKYGKNLKRLVSKRSDNNLNTYIAVLSAQRLLEYYFSIKNAGNTEPRFDMSKNKYRERELLKDILRLNPSDSRIDEVQKLFDKVEWAKSDQVQSQVFEKQKILDYKDLLSPSDLNKLKNKNTSVRSDHVSLSKLDEEADSLLKNSPVDDPEIDEDIASRDLPPVVDNAQELQAVNPTSIVIQNGLNNSTAVGQVVIQN